MRFQLLDPLRGLAAVWVVCVHYGFSQSFKEDLPPVHSFLKAGELGVAMFFVISGYCLSASASSAIRKDEPTSSFLYRRCRRIYPPLWASMAVVCAIPFLIEALSWVSTGHYVWPSASNPHYGFIGYSVGDWLSVGTLTRAFNPTGETIGDKFTSINAVYWSLAVEVQFYVVVAFGLIFRSRLFTVLALISVVSIPFSFIEAWYLTGIFLPWWPMFGWGILLFWLLKNNQSPVALFKSAAAPICLLSLCAVFAGVLFWLSSGREISQQVFSPIFALGLWLISPFDDRFSAYRQAKAIWIRGPIAASIALGAISYSVYLIHGRLQFLVIQVVRQIMPEASISRDLVNITLLVLACIPFYFLAERPFVSSPRRNRQSGDSNDGTQPAISATN